MAGPKVAATAEARDQDRRKTILRAAVEVFARKGYHGCRIADVAKEAGVAYGLVYHYFRNKEELLQLVSRPGGAGSSPHPRRGGDERLAGSEDPAHRAGGLEAHRTTRGGSGGF